MPEFPRTFDVVVTGGGPAGSATALLLARAGISALLLECSSEKVRAVGETLPPAASSLLRNLGVWDTFLRDNHLPSPGVVSVWGSFQPQLKDSSSIDGEGWSIDRARFDTTLRERGRDEGVCVALGARITSCEPRDGQDWSVTFARHHKQHRVSARYLVDATGKTGTPALQCLPSRVVRDNLIGVVRSFHTEQANSYALVEAVEEGWFYSTSVPNHHLIVVYFSDADIYAHGCKSNRSYLRAQLETAANTLERVAPSKPAGEPLIVSAATSARRTVAGRAWIAVGDAALSFDPLSSLGIFKALDSATRASESILDFLRSEVADPSYQYWSNHVFENYLTNQRRFYSRERRWPGSEFWKRRHN